MSNLLEVVYFRKIRHEYDIESEECTQLNIKVLFFLIIAAVRNSRFQSTRIDIDSMLKLCSVGP